MPNSGKPKAPVDCPKTFSLRFKALFDENKDKTCGSFKGIS